jgi:glycosyltransferase involved in cell wall biosynthesis
MPELKISVITVCFNAENTIEKTIRSVCSQTYSNIEYIIIDGASTDKTLEIVNKYSSKISKIVSEKDKGIYDAMNKGISLATGNIVYFLNADDYLCDDNVLSNIAQAFIEDSSRTVVYGNGLPEEVPEHIAPFLKKEFQFKSIDDFTYRTICHQLVFAKRSLFNDVGSFDCQYKYSADYDWLIRAFKYKPSGFFYLDRNIARYCYVGRSFQYDALTRQENTRIRFKYFLSPRYIWYFIRYDLIRGLKKRILNEKW